MAEEKVVVDASIVAKWFLEEPFSDKAIELRDKHLLGDLVLIAPSLLVYEVLNALRYSSVYSKDELASAAESINKYGLDLRSLTEESKRKAIEIAMDFDISIYDAAYVGLAETLGIAFYTTDEEVVKTCQRLKIVRHVRELG